MNAERLPARRGRILVLDDEPAICNAVRRALRQEHDVIVATSAEEVLARIGAGERFDLLLCDLVLPGMGGAELYDLLLETSPEQARRVVFITGGIYTRANVRFLASVPNRCLEKPWTAAALLTVVKEHVG